MNFAKFFRTFLQEPLWKTDSGRDNNSYGMLQNARAIPFTIPQLLKGKLTTVGEEGRVKLSHPLPRKHIFEKAFILVLG